MKMKDLLIELQKKSKEPTTELQQYKAEWLQAINDLYGDIEKWLRPLTAAGTVSVERSEIQINEVDLGTYSVPVLHITNRRLTVALEPVGALVVGMISPRKDLTIGIKGRVDLKCGPVKIHFLRKSDGAWVALQRRGTPRTLTEEVFAEMLGELFL